MNESLDQRLQRIKQILREKQKLEAMLAELNKRRTAAADDLSHHQAVLRSEKADVDKLEGLSVAGLFLAILGTKEQRLSKERQEFLAAKLKHDQTAQVLKETRQAIDQLVIEINSREYAEAEFQKLIDEKRKLLGNSNKKLTGALLKLSDQLAERQADHKELQEAIGAGELALNSLRRVATELKSAENWGLWDMWAGGMIATAMKHSKIDEAKSLAHSAQQHLQQFQAELAEAGQRLQVSLELDGFSQFADFFFDGLIVDWVVQSKIEQASSTCSFAIMKVLQAIDQCRRKLNETAQAIEALNQQRTKLIERAK